MPAVPAENPLKGQREEWVGIQPHPSLSCETSRVSKRPHSFKQRQSGMFAGIAPPCSLLMTAHSFAILCPTVCCGGIFTSRDNSVMVNLFFSLNVRCSYMCALLPPAVRRQPCLSQHTAPCMHGGNTKQSHEQGFPEQYWWLSGCAATSLMTVVSDRRA